MDGYFKGLFEGTKYEPFLQEAVTDMPVYVNTDELAFKGRSRPRGTKDIKDKMDTVTCIRTGLENSGQVDKLAEVNKILSDSGWQAPAEQKKRGRADYSKAVADMSLSGDSQDGLNRTVAD